MITPNWQHHSKKEQKRTLKPQALRRARRRLKMFKLKMKFVSVKQRQHDASDMKYQIGKRHVFVDSEPVRMYFINDIPFAFDGLEHHQKQDKWILTECAINPEYTLEDILRWGDYLMEEECHPVLFELDLLNREILPE